MFNKYKRIQIAEMRHISTEEFANGPEALQKQGISVSDADISKGYPTLACMVARNPKDHNDQWLVNCEYFKDNFESM